MSRQASKQKYSGPDEEALLLRVLSPGIRDDPEKFVDVMYPWGQKNTPLERFDGPRRWQRQFLQRIAKHIRDGKSAPEAIAPLWKAVSSGRGPGKSALVAWLIHWMMSTRLGSSTIVSANTEQQLKTKTWGEVGKWFAMAANSHWFDIQATAVLPAEWFGRIVRDELKIDTEYYYAVQQTWSEENPDAYAGAHNWQGILLIFDEASGIPTKIGTVAMGFFTEPIIDRYWFQFSNPRNNTGFFYDAFHDENSSWETQVIDCRTIEGVDQSLYKAIIDKFGEDSDEARIEVRGMFPARGERQFIASASVDAAREREVAKDVGAPLILGVDIARFGSDKTVFRWRRGRDASEIHPVKIAGLDNAQVAEKLMEWIDTTHPDAVCIDAGNGTGVIDILRSRGYRCHEVWFGARASDEARYANRRTEIWAEMRDWLETGAIDNDPDLKRDLVGPEYDFTGAEGYKIMLEPKQKTKRRTGQPSPDDGDALACTFAVRVARRDAKAGRSRIRVAQGMDYDLFAR